MESLERRGQVGVEKLSCPQCGAGSCALAVTVHVDTVTEEEYETCVCTLCGEPVELDEERPQDCEDAWNDYHAYEDYHDIPTPVHDDLGWHLLWPVE